MKELIKALKGLIGQEVKDLFQYRKMEINVLLYRDEDLGSICNKTTAHIKEFFPSNELVIINFINSIENILKSFNLGQKVENRPE